MANQITFHNPAELLRYISDPANYKTARKKSYTIWCAKPSLGTTVYNNLEDCNYTTTAEKQFVLSGTRGEQWVIDINKLAKTYTFGDGTPITEEALKAKLKNGVIDWFQVKTITDNNTLFAVFVPANYQFQVPTSWGDVLNGNRPEIAHGKGDFVLCANANGQPNVQDRWIVNGAVFADTYDNRGWGDCLAPSENDGNVPKPQIEIVATAPKIPPEKIEACFLYLRQFRAAWLEMCAAIVNMPFEAATAKVEAFYQEYYVKTEKTIDSLCTSIPKLEATQAYPMNSIIGILSIMQSIKNQRVMSNWLLWNKFCLKAGFIGQRLETLDEESSAIMLYPDSKFKEAPHFDFTAFSVRQDAKVRSLTFIEHALYGPYTYQNIKKTITTIAGVIANYVKELGARIAEITWDEVMRNTGLCFAYADFNVQDGINNIKVGRTKNTEIVGKTADEAGVKDFVTIYFKSEVDKNTGVLKGHVKARDSGVKFDKTFTISRDTVMKHGVALYAFSIYVSICKELHVSPFDFITSRSFLSRIVNEANKYAMSDSIAVNSYMRGDKYLFKIKQDSFTRKTNGQKGELSACKYTLRFFDTKSNKVIKEVPMQISLKMYDDAMGASKEDIKSHIKLETDDLDKDMIEILQHFVCFEAQGVSECVRVDECGSLPALLSWLYMRWYAVGKVSSAEYKTGTELTAKTEILEAIHNLQKLASDATVASYYTHLQAFVSNCYQEGNGNSIKLLGNTYKSLTLVTPRGKLIVKASGPASNNGVKIKVSYGLKGQKPTEFETADDWKAEQAVVKQTERQGVSLITTAEAVRTATVPV